MKTLILNSSNVLADGTNSRFVYQFPQGGYTFKDDLIAVQSISQYFSTFNITTAYANNSFSYIWVDGTTHTVNIPDGFYQITDINAYLHSVQYANKHYLEDTTAGTVIYLQELVVNQSKYAVQLNSYVISSALATTNGWTLPAGATWVLPTNLILPYLVVPSTNFRDVIGFSAGQYPAGAIAGAPPAQTQTPAFTTAQSFLSTTAPQITPYSSFIVYCSLVNNKAVIPNQLIFSYTPTDATFGALQTYDAKAELAWNQVVDGQYTQFIVEFRDQLGRFVKFQDPNTLITLITKNKSETV